MRTSIVLILTVSLGLDIAGAQVTTGILNGIVVDESGARVPGAAVVLTNEDRGGVTRKTTDETGEFVFNFVPAGHYTLAISKTGFVAHRASGLEIQSAQSIRQTFTLKVGQTTESVNVTAEASLVNTSSAEQRESFQELAVRELPLARRNFSQILSQGAGIVSAGSGKFNLNGLGGAGTRITVDGTEASADARASGTAMFQGFNRIDLMSLEAIGEVQVIKGVIPAEYGQALGGSINVITRSGTNQYHGSLFYNYQGASLAARHQFLTSKPNFVWNQFGGSAGGPILKDRLFFFGAYEGYRESNFQFLSQDVPTQGLRDRILAAPAWRSLAETKPLLDQLPLPNVPHGPAASSALWQGPGSSTTRDDHLDLKGDLRVGSAGQLSATYTRGRPDNRIPRVHPGNFRTFEGTHDRVTSSFTWGAARWTSETRFGFNYTTTNRLDAAYNVGAPDGKETVEGQRRLASIRCDRCPFSGPAGEIRDEDPRPFNSLEEKVAYVRGRHSLKIGGIWSRRGSGRFNVENPIVRYNTEVDLLANIPNTVTIAFGTPRFIGRDYQVGLFAQDDWRVHRKLVVNLGLRWDYFSNYVARGEDQNNPFLSAGLFNPDGILDSRFRVGPVRDINNPIEADALNLGPRIGFAYNPDGAGRMVVRGGYSVMFTQVPIAWFLLSVGRSPIIPFRTVFSRAESEQFGLKFPVYNEDVFPILQRLGQVRIESTFDPNLQNPYAHNFYLGIQRTLTSTMMFETAAVSTRGVKFTMRRDANLPDRVTGVRPNPDVGGFRYLDNSQQTFHYSWQSSLRKQFSRGLLFNLHYTLGKTLAYSGGDNATDAEGEATFNTQDFFCVRCERGPATSDIRHYFAANWVYETPTLASHGPLVRHAMKGWQISGTMRARSGLPFMLGQAGSLPSQRPDLVNPDAVYAAGCCAFGSLQYLNRAAFALVPEHAVSRAQIRPGSLGNNALRLLGRWDLDLGLGKSLVLPWSEQARLQVRADLLNAFNHTNYTGVRGDLNSSTFGVITNTAGARVVQINARLTF